MSNEMKYEVHLDNGEVWYCQDLMYAKDLNAEHPLWVDEEIDLVMVGSVEKRKIYATDAVPSLVYLPQSPTAVLVLRKTVVAAYDIDTDNHMENFA